MKPDRAPRLNAEARRSLAEATLWMAPVRCRALGLRRTHAIWDDAVQEASVAIVRATERYKPARGVPFDVFVRHAVDGAIKACLCSMGPVAEPIKRVSRRASRGDRVHPKTTDSLDHLQTEDTEDEWIEAMERRELTEWLHARLGDLEPDQREAALAWARDMLATDLAQRMGVHRNTLLQRKAEAMEYLKEMLTT